MSTTLVKEALGVRDMLNNPLSQAPSLDQIYNELEAEYQNATNEINELGNANTTDTFTLTTVAGQRAYQITGISNQDFYKALNAVTVPVNEQSEPEYSLEFMELEHMPKEWEWLGTQKGQYLYSSHDSQMIAFYRKIGSTGEELWVELRPTPNKVQDYKILYQITDWWDKVFAAASPQNFLLPYSSQRMYIRALVANNLVLAGKVKWSFDDAENKTREDKTVRALENKLVRYKEAFDSFKMSLSNSDVTFVSPYAEDWF